MTELLGALRLCTEPWGECEIRAGDPAIELVRDAVYVPYQDGHAWGIFDRSGHPVMSTVDRHGPDHNTYGQVLAIGTGMVRDAADAPEADYVYAGTFSLHYGHFLINTLPRFWAVSQFGEGTKFVCHGPGVLRDWFRKPFVRSILEQLGLSGDSLVVFSRPTRISRLIVPHTSFEEQHYAYPAFVRLCRTIGDRAMPHAAGIDRFPVYLSKSGLREGVGRVVNEGEIDDFLSRRGVQIVFPERLSFEEQLQLFRDAPVIAGTLGSAFHTPVSFCV